MPHRQLVKIGGGALRQKLATKALARRPPQEASTHLNGSRIQKKCFFCASFGHRQSHKERLVK
jgi:hypothetical protein